VLWPGRPAARVTPVQRRWILPEAPPHPLLMGLLRDFRLPLAFGPVLARQGILSADEAELFLNPKLRSLSDPFLLPDMAAAVARLNRALSEGESIALYGDYDVDGVASLAILARLLKAYGARVSCFLPHRVEEGYGLSAAGIARCFEEHSPTLLIAVDCGTNSEKEVADARTRGADVIVLDHHEVTAMAEGCAAVVNPKRGPDFNYLCSAGIVFKFAHALLKTSPLPGFDLRHLLDLVALATLCDLVPLVAENRLLVRKGLAQMAASRWPGLSALMAAAAVRPPVRAGDVGFRLGPRINASGRLGTARESLALLLTDEPHEATRLAASLDHQNRERQVVERDVALDVEKWIGGHFDPARDTSIVVGHRDWHAGVLGIVASRVARRHHRPAIVVGFDKDGGGKGSGRSIAGFSLVDALGRCAPLLDRFGGHEMAAGLSVSEAAFGAFREEFDRVAREMTHGDMLVPRTHLDAEMPLDLIDGDLIDAQDLLEPFGMANPQPLLYVRGVTPISAPVVLKEKHLRFQLPNGRDNLWAIFFNGAARELPRPPWDVAFHIERNEFRGRISPQLQIVDIRAAA